MNMKGVLDYNYHINKKQKRSKIIIITTPVPSIGFPFEIFIEKILNIVKLKLFMGNQIIIGKK